VATTPRRPRKSLTPVVRIIEAHGSARSGWEAAVKAAMSVPSRSPTPMLMRAARAVPLLTAMTSSDVPTATGIE